MKLLGVETLLLSNAAGGMNRPFKVGELMVLTDHISLFIVESPAGSQCVDLGPRFSHDMSEPYDRAHLVQKWPRPWRPRLKIDLHEGVYAGVTGPTFETRGGI